MLAGLVRCWRGYHRGVKCGPWAGAGLTALGVVLLAGCGNGTPDVVVATATERPEVSVPRLLAECAAATEAEVGALSGLGSMRQVTSNPLQCRWEGDTAGSSAVFRWFRGSPIDEYRKDATDPAASRDVVDIDGHTGYEWRSDKACETAVRWGDGDFIAWLVRSPQQPVTDLCTGARKLLDQTLTKG